MVCGETVSYLAPSYFRIPLGKFPWKFTGASAAAVSDNHHRFMTANPISLHFGVIEQFLQLLLTKTTLAVIKLHTYTDQRDVFFCVFVFSWNKL